MRKISLGKFVRPLLFTGAVNVAFICWARRQFIRMKEAHDIEEPPDYNIRAKDLSKYSDSDRKKLRFALRSRRYHLRQLQDPKNSFDVLIIGGGQQGAHVALEAAGRGLFCAVIDKADFAAGASGREGLLVDIRSQRGWKGLMERLDERNYRLNSAAYLSKRVDLVVPCAGVFSLARFYAKACIVHFLAFWKWCFADYTYNLPMPTVVSKEKMKELFPLMPQACYGVRVPEPQISSARATLQTLLTASIDKYTPTSKGAVLGNYVEFLDFVKDPAGTCIGARLRDRSDSKEFTVSAKAIVNCAGTSADLLRVRDDPKVGRRVEGVKTVFAALSGRKYCRDDVGLRFRDGTFVLPLEAQHCMLGAIRKKCNVADRPIVTETELKELLARATRHFAPPVAKDCVSSWCSIRLAQSESSPTSAAQRSVIDRVWLTLRHPLHKPIRRIEVSDSGLITPMSNGSVVSTAGAVVDTVLRLRPALVAAPESGTMATRLIGGYTVRTLDGSERNAADFIPAYVRYLHERYGLEWDVCGAMVQEYGTGAARVAQYGKAAGLNMRLHGDVPAIKAQVVYAVKKELAMHVKDVVFRRLGVGFHNQKLTEETIERVADVMATELDWSRKKKQAEIADAKDSIRGLL